MTDTDESQSLNVLMFAGDFFPKESGGAFIDWNVAKHLVKSGDSVIVVTPRNADTASAETVEGIEIRRPFSGHSSEIHPNSKQGIFRRLLFVGLVIPYLFKLCWKHDFDLVYSTNHLAHLPSTIVSAVFGFSHISFVGYSPSINEDGLLGNPLILLERLNFRFFMGERVLCRSPSIRDLLLQIRDRGVILLDGIVDGEAINSAVSSAGSKPHTDSELGVQLIYVGRLVEVKNPTELPELVSQLPHEYSLRIVGDGRRREAVEAAIEEAGVGSRVTLEGRLPHEETLQLIYNADLLLLASEVESYGAVTFEALALNTPVLATPVDALRSIDHPKLTIAELDEFHDIIPKIGMDSTDGIDTDTLDRFAVERFCEDARNQMLDSE